jgi:hypothetical protein
MKKCTEYKIGTTAIKEFPEDDPDFSHYGKFTDDIGPGVIVRTAGEFYERLPAEMERDVDGRFIGKGGPEYSTYSREYNGWIPGNHIPHNPKNWSHVSRKDKSEVIKKYGSLKNADYAYALEDFKRIEEMIKGYWMYISIVVETRITTDTGLSDVVRSSLSGIESDCKDHIEEVIRELKEENRAQLLKMGFSEDEIKESLDNAVEVE